MNQALKVLHLEDSPEDSELVQRMLAKEGFNCVIKRVETRAQLFKELENSTCDIILSDCTLPSFSGFQALEIARALKPDVPFIFVSGTLGEETAIKSLQDGATDYVLKHRLSRLVPSVQRALADASENALLRTMRARLDQARRLKVVGTFGSLGSFTSDLARDYNNLLRVIKTKADELSSGPLHVDKIGNIGQMLKKVADHGSERLEELLLFVRSKDAHFISLTPNQSVDEVVEGHQHWLPGNIRIVLQLPEDSPDFFVDPGQIHRILSNLIVNACEAMPDGGTLTIGGEVICFVDSGAPALQGNDVLYFCLKVSGTSFLSTPTCRVRAAT